MALISPPPIAPVDDALIATELPSGLKLSMTWTVFFNSAYNILNALTSSGTTVNRPTKFLFTGRTFFDTTLGLPIYYKTSSWVKADGTAA